MSGNREWRPCEGWLIVERVEIDAVTMEVLRDAFAEMPIGTEPWKIIRAWSGAEELEGQVVLMLANPYHQSEKSSRVMKRQEDVIAFLTELGDAQD